MNTDQPALIPYLRALITVTHLGSLLTLSELLRGQALAFAAPLAAGALMWLLAAPLTSLFCRGGRCRPPRWTALLLTALTLLHAAVILSVTASYLSATFLHHTPRWALLALLLAVPVSALFRTEGALMRLCRLVFPALALMVGLILFYQTQWQELTAILAALPYEEISSLPEPVLLTLLLVYLNPTVATPLLFGEATEESWLRASRQGILLSAVTLSLLLLLPVTALGLPLYEAPTHPLYSAGNAIIHGTPLVRVDTLLSTIVLFSVLTDLCLTARAVRLVLREFGIGERLLRES